MLIRRPHYTSEWPHSWVVRVAEDIPEYFSAIIGDAVHNLRSAFDLLACAMVRANGGSDKNVQFPIARNIDCLEAAIQHGKIDRASPQTLDFIRGLKPYHGDGGNWALCAIHDLDILDKHRLIIAVANIAQFNRVVAGLTKGTSVIAAMPGYAWNLKDGAKLIDTIPETGINVGDELAATYTIAFRHGQPLSGTGVITALIQLADYVQEVMDFISIAKIDGKA